MMLNRRQAIIQLQVVGRYMIEHDSTWGSGGNMSGSTMIASKQQESRRVTMPPITRYPCVQGPNV